MTGSEYGYGERQIDKALAEAMSALAYLLMQGTDLGLQHESYIRTSAHLIERIRADRAIPRIEAADVL